MTAPQNHWWRVPESTHNGLMARAAPGTHEAVADMLVANKVPVGPSIDLAAGTGALLSRLREVGFNQSQGIELNQKQYELKEVPVQSLDLNKNFSDHVDGPFQLVSAVEIIEHLDAPRHFVEQVYGMLKPGGYTIISTPNIGHWLSRLQIMYTGVPKYFTEHDYHEQRHISPIFDHHMRIMLKEVGFELVEFRCTASSWGKMIRAMTFPIAVWFRAFCKGPVDGNVNLYLARKV